MAPHEIPDSPWITGHAALSRLKNLALPSPQPPRLCRMPCNSLSRADPKRGSDSEANGGMLLFFTKRPISIDFSGGIDVLVELSSVCILNASGRIVREVKIASGPKAFAAFLVGLGLPLPLIGVEAGPLS